MAYVPVLGAWMACAKRESSWSIAPVCAGMLPTRTSGPFGRMYVTFRPNKDAFELTSGPNVSGIAYVESCPTLLVESESHQHINPNAKYISTPGLTLLCEARTKT